MIVLLFFTLDTLYLNLEKTIDIGLKNALEIRESEQSVNQSRVGVYDALSDLLPTPSSYYEMSHTEDIFDTTSYNWNLTLNQAIFNTSIIYSIINGFDQLSLSKISLKEKILSTVYDITESYIKLILNFAAKNNLKLSKERAGENYRLAKIRYEIGQVSRLDLLQAEIAIINANKNLIDNENSIDELEEHLKNLLDTNCHIIPTDTLSLPETKIDLKELVEGFEINNLSIQSARKNRSIANKDLIFSYLAALPSVSIFLSYNYRSYNSPGSIGEIWDDKYKSYGLRADFPIFNIKDILLGIMQSRIKKKQAEINLRITAQRQKENLSTQIRIIRSSNAEIELNKKSLEASVEAMKLAQERYRAGVGSLLSLLTAQSDLENSEANYLKALGDYYLALARIVYLTGKGEG